MEPTHSRNTVVIYEGPSAYDDRPIVVFATGFARKSSNPKTGHMIQTYIVRADINPMEALKSGAAKSVCGGCPLLNNGCYVRVYQAPLSMWRAWQRGRYRAVALEDLTALASGRAVRIGAYGDPAAVPLQIWEQLMVQVPTWTGYTHGWRSVKFQGLRRWCMASVETDATALAARERGWATFRVRPKGDLTLDPDEQRCPASAEMGHVTNCLSCGRCGGLDASDRLQQMQYISIQAHGSRAGRIAA